MLTPDGIFAVLSKACHSSDYKGVKSGKSEYVPWDSIDRLYCSGLLLWHLGPKTRADQDVRVEIWKSRRFLGASVSSWMPESAFPFLWRLDANAAVREPKTRSSFELYRGRLLLLIGISSNFDAFFSSDWATNRDLKECITKNVKKERSRAFLFQELSSFYKSRRLFDCSSPHSEWHSTQFFFPSDREENLLLRVFHELYCNVQRQKLLLWLK